MTKEIHIERHDGPPIRTLDDVRRSHNVVGAFRDVEAARTAILSIEQAGVEPESISLLGAWPTQDKHRAPVLMYRRMTYMALIGALALGIAGYFALGRSSIWAMTGAIVGASVGGIAGWALAIGLSQAWEDTFAVDDAGTFAVGVHSDDPEEILRARPVLEKHGALAINEFEGETRRRGRWPTPRN